jgi:hypothetical protein
MEEISVQPQTEEKNERLYLVTEGGAHTVEYFHNNGVYPFAVVFDANKFREIVPYLTKDDEILVIIKGLTDFSMSEIYALLNDIKENEGKLQSITVMSNINLGKIPAPYYLYSGDLFYGTLKEVRNGKITDLIETPKELIDGDKKSKVTKKDKLVKVTETIPEERSINAVLSTYKKYSKRGVIVTIYGSTSKEADPSYELDSLTEKILIVDLFQK